MNCLDRSVFFLFHRVGPFSDDTLCLRWENYHVMPEKAFFFFFFLSVSHFIEQHAERLLLVYVGVRFERPKKKSELSALNLAFTMLKANQTRYIAVRKGKRFIMV